MWTDSGYERKQLLQLCSAPRAPCFRFITVSYVGKQQNSKAQLKPEHRTLVKSGSTAHFSIKGMQMPVYSSCCL